MSNAIAENKKAAIGLGALGGVAVLAAAWFFLVAPQQTKADDLEKQTAVARSELAARKVALATPSARITVKAGDTFRLTKAVPDATNMAGVILDLNRLAARHKLSFTSITPSAQQSSTGYLAQPVAVEVQGRFTSVSEFLGELRRLVRVRNGRLDARGRIYSTTNVDLSESETKFPNVKATLTIETYTLLPPTAADTPATVPPSSTPSTSATVAAGANP